MRVLLSIILLSTNCAEQTLPASHGIVSTISEKIVYCSAAAALGTLSILSRLVWEMSLLSPLPSSIGKECLFLSQLSGSAAYDIFAHMLKEPSSVSSVDSWYANKTRLSQVPTFTDEEKKLLHFLETRWLAKATGFFSSAVNWVYPCFGISMQVHPESTSHYARNPWNKLSATYEKRAEAWKQALPHPHHFPLILTRPSGIQDYLPTYIDVQQGENIQATIQRLLLKMQTARSKIVVDLTSIFPDNPQEWLSLWNDYQARFSQACIEQGVNPKKLLFIQRVQQEELGGIRLLPLAASSPQRVERHYRSLLKWISHLGLTANRIELDRWPSPSITPVKNGATAAVPSRLEFLAYLDSFEATHPQKNLMLTGTVQALKGLLANLSEERWNEIVNSPTKSQVVEFTLSKLKEELQQEDAHFFEAASHLEQVHAHISALLEIFSPFVSENFPAIYRDILNIPMNLKPLTSCAVHASGMTSVAGILKAMERTLGKAPCVLYGENTYFECILLAQRFSQATSVLDATVEDCQNADLIFAQFNPALKRIDLKPTEYHVEPIAETLRSALSAEREKPLTLAVDCTLDYLDSPRTAQLLEEFQKEIASGMLNVVCYRSGIKFDLFGMDNYSGAPFYMIHNQDPKWSSFDRLLTDPALQTDRLSLNWFCLAYQSAAPQLELYRKQIFDNTRALLHKVPSRLFNENSNYRIVYVEEDADVAFVDIKISGPLHQLKGALLVGGSLYMNCMEEGHPIFYRPSLGFYHPNFTMLFSEENTTIRLTLGLDPAQVDVLTQCFERIDKLNYGEAI